MRSLLRLLVAALSALTLVTGTNAGDYAPSSNCPLTTALAPGASCVIDVVFGPRAAGKRTASIAITHSASTTVASIPLTGTGVYLVDGFEDGTVAGWTAAGAATVQTSVDHGGSFAAALTPGAVDGGTLVVVNGPRFSSRAESLEFQAQGWSVIGMTAMPEAALARASGALTS